MPTITLSLLLASLLALTADAPAGKVACAPEVYRARVEPSAEVAHAEFTLTNTCSTTARVVNVSPSCECVTVAPFKREIGPGGKIDILVDVDLKGRDGPAAKEVVLDLAGVPQKQLTLSILILRD